MTTKSFIKTIGEKGLLSDYNTEGKKLQTELTAGDNVTIANNVISADKQVIYAVYNSTPYDTVRNAILNGFDVIVRDNGYIYHTSWLNKYDTGNIYFQAIETSGPEIKVLKVSSNGWARYAYPIQQKLTFDTAPTAGSTNPVTSDGIKTALDSIIPDFGTPELSVFETFGVIGDSYASGVIYNSAGKVSSTFYNKSWPQILGRKNGINVTNYSFGGARTNTWLTNATYGLAKLLSDPALDAYAIVLSINDRNKGGAEWLGTIDDIHVGDPSLNADSFYGCYAKIIENVLSHAPNAKIFCVQHAYNETGLPKDYNDAISAIASLYNLPCVPEFEDSFFSSVIYTQMYGGHPTYVGYAGMADALCRLFRKAMVAYKDYFKQYVPIQ